MLLDSESWNRTKACIAWRVIWFANDAFMTRRINISMCLNGKEHMYISTRLVCIWFERWQVGTYLCTYIPRNVEHLYACMTKLWCHWFSCLKILVYLSFPSCGILIYMCSRVTWYICMCLLCSKISLVVKCLQNKSIMLLVVVIVNVWYK
jgi:hypothetical protein